MSRGLLVVYITFVMVISMGEVLNSSDQLTGQSHTPWLEIGPHTAQPIVVKHEMIQASHIETREGYRGYDINVMLDCWTTDIEDVQIDPELETYLFGPDSVVFVWKHKILHEGCSNYISTIVGLLCEDGKPRIMGRVDWIVPNISFGDLEPGEWMFTVHVRGIPEGTWDWFVVTECNDTNGTIPPTKDGNIDDVIGANLGTMTYPPVVYGPEPVGVLDPDLGGYPPGRLPGEGASCRCWCFTVTTNSESQYHLHYQQETPWGRTR